MTFETEGIIEDNDFPSQNLGSNFDRVDVQANGTWSNQEILEDL